jgi:hypothetical protein
MRSLLLAVVACSLVGLETVAAAATPFPYSWQTKYYTAQIDNLSFGSSGKTFQIKYLVADQYYKEGGPIFFYTVSCCSHRVSECKLSTNSRAQLCRYSRFVLFSLGK